MKLRKDNEFVTFAYLTSDDPVPDYANVWTLFWRTVFSFLLMIPMIVVYAFVHGSEETVHVFPEVGRVLDRVFPIVRFVDDDDVENDME